MNTTQTSDLGNLLSLASKVDTFYFVIEVADIPSIRTVVGVLKNFMNKQATINSEISPFHCIREGVIYYFTFNNWELMINDNR